MILSESSGVPYWRQIRDQLASQIHGGALASGARLPSIRRLSGDLRLSVITVQKAYDELEAEGLIVSKQGRGSFVCEGTGAASRTELLDHIEAELNALLGRAKAAGLAREELEVLVSRALIRTGLAPSTGACRTPAA